MGGGERDYLGKLQRSAQQPYNHKIFTLTHTQHLLSELSTSEHCMINGAVVLLIRAVMVAEDLRHIVHKCRPHILRVQYAHT